MASAAARRAARAYARLREQQNRTDELSREHLAAVALIPPGEEAAYYALTEAIRHPPVIEPAVVLPPGEPVP
jgi:hypothetical protein